jgi:hypothetical protein
MVSRNELLVTFANIWSELSSQSNRRLDLRAYYCNVYQGTGDKFVT